MRVDVLNTLYFRYSYMCLKLKFNLSMNVGLGMCIVFFFLDSETDYPPKADAGSDVVIHLPQDSVILYGNSSTDDKGIKSYEWIKSADDKLTADMTVCQTILMLLKPHNYT